MVDKIEIQPKTIHIERKRKINPALISRKFEYMSDEVTAGAWMDVPDDADLNQATADLIAYVNGEIQAQVEEITERYRKIARANYVDYNMIEPAFRFLMSAQNIPENDLDVLWTQFRNSLEHEMAKESV